MKPTYICANNAKRMRLSEVEAIRYWLEMMRRGIHAYDEARCEAAEIYLGSAVDIGMLRYTRADNCFFNDTHISEPLMLLVKTLFLMEKCSEAIDLVTHISSNIAQRSAPVSTNLTSHLIKLSQYLSANNKYPPNYTYREPRAPIALGA